MTNEIKTSNDAKLGTKVGEAVVYVVFSFGSFAHCGVDLYEGLTMEECVALRSEDIESYKVEGGEWTNMATSADDARQHLMELRDLDKTRAELIDQTKAELSKAREERSEDVEELAWRIEALDAEADKWEADHQEEIDNAVAEAVQDELDEEAQKAKTAARADDLIEKTRRYIDLFETGRSAWDKGVRVYADELLDELRDAILGGWVDLEDMASEKLVDRALLNGAADWKEYSWGGCSLIYDGDIAERLCTPSELKKTRHGERRPNSREEWLDTQGRALCQAAGRVRRGIRYAIRTILEEEVA